MKQLLNNWLKINHLFNFKHYKHRAFAQNCLLCAANLHEIALLNTPSDAREEHDALQANSHQVCRACLKDLPWHAASSCPQCGLKSSGIVCGSCLNSPPDFDATHAIFLYQFPIDVMMQRYKYGAMLNLADTFGAFLSNKVSLDQIDLIMPMPMHPARIKARGFNQALEIAKYLYKQLAKNSSVKLDIYSTQRVKLTPPQASLPLKQRVKNIKGAFHVSANLTGKRIAIVDDVMTTGASLNELAKTLKKAGAVHVECWVIARTLPH